MSSASNRIAFAGAALAHLAATALSREAVHIPQQHQRDRSEAPPHQGAREMARRVRQQRRINDRDLAEIFGVRP